MWRCLGYIWFVLRTKGLIGGLIRIGMLVARFDFSGARMRKAVVGIADLGRRFRYNPALIVPAVVLRRHSRLLQDGTCKDLELAIHGYTHRDLRPVGLEQQVQEIERAKATFVALNAQVCGFRAPYLSCNQHTDEAVSRCRLKWNSDKAFMSRGIVNSYIGRPRRFIEKAMQRLYKPDDAAERILTPWLYGDVVCIPILLPDDEILVDRLGIDQPDVLGDIWLKMLKWTQVRGGLFVLQLHPERFGICAKAMEVLLEQASKPDSQTWIAGMHQIADWWIDRHGCKFQVKRTGGGCYQVCFEGPQSATLVGLNLPPQLGRPFHCGYRQITARDLELETDDLKPCIGIHPNCSPDLVAFVRNAGFAFEWSAETTGYAFCLGPDESFCPQDEVRLLRRIESCGRPILRCWPWPDGYRSAFTTTHDLDCVTLTDFLYRITGR